MGTRGDQTTEPAPMEVTWGNLLCPAWSILFHFLDLYSDINVARYYFAVGEVGYTTATILIMLVPSIVMTLVSCRMYQMDRDVEVSYEWNSRVKIRMGLLVFQLGPILRYIDSFTYAYKSWRAAKRNDKEQQEKYYIMMLKEDADAALLGIFKCFLESAPQQVLQFSYLLKAHYLKAPVNPGFTGYDPHILAVFSFVGMAVGVMTYQRSIRVQEDKDNMNWTGSFFIFSWHLFVTISRILMLSTMLFISWIGTIIAIYVHWLLMTVSLSLMESHKFCSSHNSIKFGRDNTLEKVANFLFSAVLGLVYIFTYIAPGEGGTCFQYTCYYSFCFVENIIGAFLWYYYYKETNWLILCVSIVPFVFGCAIMVAYYREFHPKKVSSACG